MIPVIKQCAESNDIKRLRYIFADSLDVDPTFDKYREDYEYCKTIPGLFEEHRELTGIAENNSLWTKAYYDQLKLDLMKNFSEIRFNHMIHVAEVVYADKIKRLKIEREKLCAEEVMEVQERLPEEKRKATEGIALSFGRRILEITKAGKTVRYEISGDGSSLRKTLFKEKQRIEYFYCEVKDWDRRKTIEARSENWRILGNFDPSCEFFIFEQCDARNNFLGFIKIVKKSEAQRRLFAVPHIFARPEDWHYYERLVKTDRQRGNIPSV